MNLRELLIHPFGWCVIGALILTALAVGVVRSCGGEAPGQQREAPQR